MTPIYSGGICTGFLFQSVELDSRQRPAIDLFDISAIDQRARPDYPLIIMCSWCQRFHYPPVTGKDWLEAEAYYAAGGTSKVRISHGICDDCLEATDPSNPDVVSDGKFRS